MRIASFVLLVALMVTVSVAPAQIVNPANGHTYILVGNSTQNVLVAKFNANALGGYLVAINDPAEDAFIQANFPGSYWIGLSDSASEGTFVWDNGDPLTYTAWCPSEPSATAPNHDFVFMDSVCPGQWNDQSATPPWGGTGFLGPGLVEIPSATPHYQGNSAEASMDIDGAATDGFSPALVTKCTGFPSNVNFSGSLAGNPWDMGYYFSPLVAGVVGVGLVTAGGQVVNLDLGQPLNFLNGTTSPNLATSSFVAFTLVFAPPTALTASGQAIVVDPTHADNFIVTQGNQLDVVTGSATTQVLALGDDNSINVVTGPPLCGFGGISFYGTVYTDFHVCSNGYVSFTAGSTDFTATATEFTTLMPRVAGQWSDLSPNVGGTVQVVPNPNDITIQFIGVPEFGVAANVNSFDIIFDDAGGTSIANYSPAPMHLTASLTGITNGGNGTPGVPVSFSSVVGAGLQVSALTTDAVYEFNAGGPVPGGWSTVYFPQSDSSIYSVN